jgi:hypothetical protein
MTDSQKVEALQDLLGNVIHSLEMTQYNIDDADESYKVVLLADSYFDQMLKVLHGETVEEVS